MEASRPVGRLVPQSLLGLNQGGGCEVGEKQDVCTINEQKGMKGSF